MDKPNRLLVVDDQAEIASFVIEVAESIGFETATADTPGRLVSTHRVFQPNVIVLDLMMPDMDGVQVLHLLAAENCQADILLFSAADGKVLNTTARIAAEQGLRISKILPKPISVDDLESVLREYSVPDLPVSEAELKAAIDGERICAYYQPKVSLSDRSSGPVVGVEALARWNHPERGVISPATFIPLAEKTGLINALTEHIVDTALRTTSELSGDRWLQVAVNLSSPMLADPQIPDRFADLLRKYRLDARQLVIEITESAAMAENAQTMGNLTRFRLKGMALSMDDFGTGYSSLVQLHRMPFSELKIDRSFVLEIDESDEARIIVRSIVELAHNLGLKVCAEGVETRSALEFLCSIGCDQAQGYVISKPLDGEGLKNFLADQIRAKATQVVAVGARS